MPGPGPGLPPPLGSSTAGARGRLGARAALGRRGGGGVWVTGCGRGSGQHAGGRGSSAGSRAPSRRPPCRSIVCGGKQRKLGDSGARFARGSPPRPSPPLPPPSAARPERSARLPVQARAPGHRVPRAHAPSRPRSGRRSLGEPRAPFAAPRSRPRGSLRRGRRGKRLLAPRGDKNPNLRSHRGRARAHAQTHTHSLTHTHTLSPPPLPKGVSEEKAWGPRSLFPSPLLYARSSSRCIPLNRITMLLKRLILLIVTQEFFFITFLFSLFPSPHASFGPFF